MIVNTNKVTKIEERNAIMFNIDSTDRVFLYCVKIISGHSISYLSGYSKDYLDFTMYYDKALYFKNEDILIKEVIPKLEDKLPKAKMVIVAAICDKTEIQNENIKVYKEEIKSNDLTFKEIYQCWLNDKVVLGKPKSCNTWHVVNPGSKLYENYDYKEQEEQYCVKVSQQGSLTYGKLKNSEQNGLFKGSKEECEKFIENHWLSEDNLDKAIDKYLCEIDKNIDYDILVKSIKAFKTWYKCHQ